MQIYRTPLRDMKFALEAFGYDERITTLKAFEDYDLETVMMMLESSGRMFTETWLPLNRVGDTEGLKWNPETGDVTLADGFKEAYKAFVDAGLCSISADPKYGGAGAPVVLGVLINEMSTATNKSLSMCPGLSHGLISALEHHGSEEQKQTWLTKLLSGKWTGTMCLTEPQCGTDLGLISTKATPVEGEEGAFLLDGTKIWITFGEHNLSENIVHFVLARLPGAPPGIKGISAFIVPKFDLDGTRNGIDCTGLEHKMGIKSSPTCVMSLEGARGYLVGQPHKGMRSMFTMMNMARLQVGLEGLGLGEVAYQTALAFAKDRRQSRSLNRDRREMDAAADNILVHPDVRRMLLKIKSSNEAMRGLGVWMSFEQDVSENHPDEEARKAAADLVALMTPVIKGHFTGRGFLNISDAMQVCGGAGYTTDWSIEQYMRDERIAMIYEGTNHIQALDLVGRKLAIGGGRLVRAFGARVSEMLEESANDERMKPYTESLQEIFNDLSKITMELAFNGMKDPEGVAAIASNYLDLFGITALTYSWCVLVRHALKCDNEMTKTKLKTAKFFMEQIVPESKALVGMIASGKGVIMDFDIDEF